jgi:hypothetical protein
MPWGLVLETAASPTAELETARREPGAVVKRRRSRPLRKAQRAPTWRRRRAKYTAKPRPKPSAVPE